MKLYINESELNGRVPGLSISAERSPLTLTDVDIPDQTPKRFFYLNVPIGRDMAHLICYQHDEGTVELVAHVSNCATGEEVLAMVAAANSRARQIEIEEDLGDPSPVHFSDGQWTIGDGPYDHLAVVRVLEGGDTIPIVEEVNATWGDMRLMANSKELLKAVECLLFKWEHSLGADTNHLREIVERIKSP